MSGLVKALQGGALLAGACVMAAAAPASAENWGRFSNSDHTVYLVDLDAMTPVDGVVTTWLARVPAQGPATDLRRDTEEVMVRCADGKVRSGASVTYDASGAETDRSNDDTPWDTVSEGGVYGAIKSFACDGLRPSGPTFWPSIQAFIEGGRGK